MSRRKYLSRRAAAWAILLGLTKIGFSDAATFMQPGVQDIFGRDIAANGIILVDWEGYMANPAIEFFIVPPWGAAFPVSVTVKAPEPRLYFDLPSEAGRNGPEKQLRITGKAPVSLSVAIFPARLKKKSDTALDIQLSDAGNRKWLVKLPVHVVFTEAHDDSPTFPINVDFSQDQTGFYNDKAHQDIFKQAVQDWDFYLADMHVAGVAANSEQTVIFERDGFTKSHAVTNANAYTGFLLYTYGILGPAMRSGGEPSRNGMFQVSGTEKLPMKRSGGVEVETDGNYNRLGWLPPLSDDEWWKATNLGKVQNDLYSIVHHEIGHALFFNPNNARFPRGGVIKDDAIGAYLGPDVHVDATDHFGGFIDPASLHGAFGNEYHGRTPQGRWLITKLDLLCVEATSYKLRKVDALTPLAIRTSRLPGAAVGTPYQASLEAEGGIPFYDWGVSAGTLPAGLSLDRFTGQISGTPTKSGAVAFTVLLRDYTKNAKGVSQQFTITMSGR
jgi:hypothetical protein